MKFLHYILLTSLFSCNPAKLNSNAEDSFSKVDDRSWLTWEECGQQVGQHPCNFTLLNNDGEEVELYDYYGKIIIIDFSTMWCGVCVHIASEGDNFVARYGEENVVWLTVLVENEYGYPPTQEDLQRWVDMAGSSTPVLGADRSIIDYSAITGYPITAWPTIVVIDKEMVLKYGMNGWSSAAVDNWVGSML
jgi:thiol-disulfide isomerase/thioredoxin